jgi:small subunit ribosomal protein S12
MSTPQQLARYLKRNARTRSYRLRVFEGSPQRKGVTSKVSIKTPKKPNSAKRKIAKIRLSTGYYIDMYISGECGMQKNKLGLSKFSTVLVRYGRAPDLPGIKFQGIRGVYDFSFLPARRKKRSLYGVKKRK